MSATAIKHGIGIMTRNGVWFGQWINNGRVGYCIDPSLNLATMPWWNVTASPGVTATQVRRLSYLVTAYGNTSVAGRAAAVRLAALTIVHPTSSTVKKGLDARNGLPAGVVTLARSMVTAAINLAGPYRVVLTVGTAPLPGGPGRLSVVVRSATGKPVPAVVTIKPTNATMAATTVNTGAAGTSGWASFTRSVSAEAVTFNATTSLTSTSTLITRPPAGFQRLISWAPKQAVAARTTYQRALGAPVVSYACEKECDGTPPVQVLACNYAQVPVTYRILDNGSPVATWTLAAGACGKRSVRVPDAHTVTSSWQAHGAAPLIFSGRYVVDCPPFPDILATVSATCAAGNVTANLPRNRSTHVQRMYVNGKLAQELKPGQDLPPYILTVPCGNNTMVNFSPAVQRNNGQWNRGESIAVLVR